MSKILTNRKCTKRAKMTFSETGSNGTNENLLKSRMCQFNTSYGPVTACMKPKEVMSVSLPDLSNSLATAQPEIGKCFTFSIEIA